MNKRYIVLTATFFAIFALFLSPSVLTPITAFASSNPNLFVSAENSQFSNQFSGSMVVEVVVIDPYIGEVDSVERHPHVTINGDTLLMAQAIDGNWYAYFANAKKAQAADSTVGSPGQGLDFGVFCSGDTPSSVFGASFSSTQGFAIPRYADGSTNGNSPFSECTGSASGSNINNVLRNVKSLNTNPSVPSGQIGLDANAWPLIQLYSFGNVLIEYNPGGSYQQVQLEYGEIDNISASVDRERYPSDAQVILTLNDFQLNQDPTDRDSWTFGVVDSSPTSTFYQAYTSKGSVSANGGAGLVNLAPYLSRIGFEDNGALSVNLDDVLELKSNNEQPSLDVRNDNQVFSNIVTLVETLPNSGIFDSVDKNNKSTLKTLRDAPRDRAGSITYNDKSFSVLTGSSSATLSLGTPTLTIGDGSESLKPGTRYQLTLFDPDQNINSNLQDVLTVLDDSTPIPTMRIGDPITLGRASDVTFFASSEDNFASDEYYSLDSFISDSHSERLFIDTSIISTPRNFEKISLNLGVTASQLQSILFDPSRSNSAGTSWINYDFRSLVADLGISDLADTTIQLHFGALGNSPVTIADSGDLLSAQGLLQLDVLDVQSIHNRDGAAYLVINFDSSDNDLNVGTIQDESRAQLLIFDLFSFGLVDSRDVNNAIYRFELEETSNNSSTYRGTLEYSVSNQLNIFDPRFIQTIRPTDDDVRFIVTGNLINTNGATISYSDLNTNGLFTSTSVKSDVNTHSGTLSSNSASYRFGQTVVLTLYDPDLNLKDDLVDIYSSINDVASPHVDAVGKDDSILFEVLIKDIRYKRCTINNVQHGGLASTGFSLLETGPDTGIFEGSFKMPSMICSRSGSELISSAGGIIDAKYYDSKDDFGNQSVFRLSGSDSTLSVLPSYNPVRLNVYDIMKPLFDKDVKTITLSGSITNPKRGTPVEMDITGPNLQTTSSGIVLSNYGSYKHVIHIDKDSMLGIYTIKLSYNHNDIDTLTFTVSDFVMPGWTKNVASQWAFDEFNDSEFITVLEYFNQEGLVLLPDPQTSEVNIPNWIKTIAQWWVDGKITDKSFLASIQYLADNHILVI